MKKTGTLQRDERAMEERLRLMEMRLWLMGETLAEVLKLLNQLVMPQQEQTA